MKTFGVPGVRSITTLIPDIALVRARAHPGVIGIIIVCFIPPDIFAAFDIGLKNDSLDKRPG